MSDLFEKAMSDQARRQAEQEGRPIIYGGELGEGFSRVLLTRQSVGKVTRHYHVPVTLSDSHALVRGMERLGLEVESQAIADRELFAAVLDAAIEAGAEGDGLMDLRRRQWTSKVRQVVKVIVVRMWMWRPPEPLEGKAPRRCAACGYVGRGHKGKGRWSKVPLCCGVCRRYAVELPFYNCRHGRVPDTYWSQPLERWRHIKTKAHPIVVGKPLWEPKSNPLGRPQLAEVAHV